MLPIIEGIFVVCTRSRKNQETQEGILEWSQQLELACVELMSSRKIAPNPGSPFRILSLSFGEKSETNPEQRAWVRG